MSKVMTIAKWELIEKLKSKEFIIGLILTPLIIVAFSVLPSLLAAKEDDTVKAIGILDETRLYQKPLADKLGEYKLPDGQPRYVTLNLFKENEHPDSLKKKANKEISSKKIEGYIYIRSVDKDTTTIEFMNKAMGNFNDLRRFENSFNEARREMIIREANIDTNLAASLTKEIQLSSVKINDKGEEEKVNFQSQFFSSLIFVMMLFFIIMFTGGSLIRSLVEEKSNRLIEIIISSCKPMDLLLGKVLGLTTLVSIQLIVWALIGIAFSGPALLIFASFQNILWVLLIFGLGFLFYVSIFVGVGSIVNTEQEAQQVTGYLSMILVIPIVILLPIIQNPDQMLVKVLSYIPLTTAPVMLVRLNIASVPFIDLAIAVLILLVSSYITIRISAKIFRIGILSYGKMPNLKELMKWLKSSE